MSNILITGHSFIHRYRNYLNYSQLPQYHDLSNCLGLPEEHISIEGIGGLKADKKGITYVTNRVRDTEPDIVLLELGTNDIADSAVTHFTSPQEQVSHLIIQIHIICSELFHYGVKKVIVCEVIEWRRFRGNTTLQEFNIKRDLYNKALQFLLKQNPNIIVWRHKKKFIRDLKEGTISTDNIHITTDNRFHLYNFSLRSALIKALSKLRE